MKIAILGSPKTLESKWLKEEALRRNHECELIDMSEIFFESKSKIFQIHCENKLQDFDVFLVRGIFKDYKVGKLNFNKSTEALLVLKYLKNVLNKTVVDERLTTQPNLMSKMSTSLSLSLYGIPQPYTFQFQKQTQIKSNIKCFSYPIIIKNPNGKQGKDIYKLNSEADLLKFLETMPESFPFLFQQYLENDGDIRILVVGYKAIGAMKRFQIKGNFISNISQGAKAESYELNTDLITIAEQAAKATATEFAGVDVIESGGKYYVIEVNRAPQFKGFKMYTGLDPSAAVINYLEQKFQNNK